MRERSGDDSSVVAESAAVIAGLEGRLDEVTDMVVQHLLAEIAELRGETQLLELLRASAERNIDTVFAAIHHNIPIEHVEPPTAALEHARRLAQRGVPANALARAYRLGQQTMLDIVLNEVQLADLDPRRSLAVFRQLTDITFKYIDRISLQVIAAYETERDRWLETQNSTRALRVRELLDTETADVDAVSLAIEYPLHRWHLAVVVWCPETDQDDELVRMERLVRGLGETLGSQGRPLFVAADRVTGWAWIPLTVNSARDAVSRTRRFAEADKQAPSLAIGDPLPGVDGFRRSHRQALGAHAVALAAGPGAPRILANNDSGLSAAALLADKLDVVRVWVADVLGPLACDTEADQRLRETVRVFLRAGSSYKAAAAELNLHFNSVKYRIQRAEERRGRPISHDRLEVEFALLLCHWLRAAVLRGV